MNSIQFNSDEKKKRKILVTSRGSEETQKQVGKV